MLKKLIKEARQYRLKRKLASLDQQQQCVDALLTDAESEVVHIRRYKNALTNELARERTTIRTALFRLN